VNTDEEGLQVEGVEGKGEGQAGKDAGWEKTREVE
jgi:hypothetical protein